MSARALLLWSVFAFGALQGALACSFDDDANAAHGCDPKTCASCYLEYCLVTREEAASGGAATSGSGGVSGGSGGRGGSTGTGGAGAGGAGAGGAGAGGAGAGGAGAGGAGAGGAGSGGAGGGSGCPGVGMSVGPETCNALDDDCNGEIDDDIAIECFPASADGCAQGGDGSFVCEGLCTSGTRICEDGELSACAGAVTPVEEVCGGAEAADENCNGVIDDGCACEGNEEQRCYSGPRRTAGVGECEVGTQTCQDGAFGACEGEKTPEAETCGNPNADNNCNGVDDDVPNLGGGCFDLAQQGQCSFGVFRCQGARLVCVTTQPEETETACDGLDEDCDGNVDETFVFGSDEGNCGACNVRCPAGDLCCDGMCRDVDLDPMHCGSCNEQCDSLSCCAGDCVPTNTADRCGGCDIMCDPDQGCCGNEGCTDLNTIAHCRSCEVSCTAEQGCCEEGCADLDTTAHCGSCEVSCLEGQECCDGKCVTPSEEPCGACGTACPPGPCMFCVEGECQDPMGNVCQ
jgi:hypothetical protein